MIEVYMISIGHSGAQQPWPRQGDSVTKEGMWIESDHRGRPSNAARSTIKCPRHSPRDILELPF